MAIRTFTSTGKALPVSSKPIAGSGAPVTVTPQGQMIRHRLALHGGITGSNVKVTNPAYAKRRLRTASLGMGGVGQRGRVMDVPGTL